MAYWQTPLGNTIIDNSISNDLQNSCDFIEDDIRGSSNRTFIRITNSFHSIYIS